MTKKCPDCSTVAKLHSDYPSSFWESLLRSMGLIRVKRCSNCNAAVFVVLGVFIVSRRSIQRVKTTSFWVTFVLLLIVTGFIVFEAVVS